MADQVDIEAIASGVHEAVEKGTREAFAAAFSPDARFWFNIDQQEKSLQENTEAFVALFGPLRVRRVEQVQRDLIEGGYFERHVLHCERDDGLAVDLYSCQIVTIGADGAISRFEEYLDSAPVGQLLS